MVGGRPALHACDGAWVHSAWPQLPEATWIWRSEFVTAQEALNGSEVVTFRRRFLWTGSDGDQASIQIAVDNAYDLSINGVHVGGKGQLDVTGPNDQLWRVPDQYTFPLKKGQNEISVRAINYLGRKGSNDPKGNPAGVLFRVDASVPEHEAQGGRRGIEGP